MSSAIYEGVQRAIGHAMESKQFGDRLLRSQGIDSAAASLISPIDDGIPPAAPQWNIITPYMAGLELDLIEANPRDFVEQMKIELNKGGLITYMTVPYESISFISPLLYVPYTLRVQYIDKWGRFSEWSTARTATPAATADYLIDMAKAALNNNLSGLIPAINTSAASGNPTDTVKTIALATSGNTNLLTLREVDYEIYPTGMAWPPTDSDINDVPYITAVIPAGATVHTHRLNERMWLRHTRNAGSGASVIPFSNWSLRGAVGGQSYIVSTYVRAQNKQIRLRVEAASDTVGTGLLQIGSTGTLTPSTTESRIHLKFTVPTTHPYIRFVLDNLVEGQTVDWTRHQLEHAPGSNNEPSPWTAGVLSTGVINTRMLSAMDATIANAIFKNAAIDSAAIKQLTADKIIAGTGLFANIIVKGAGQVAAGGARLTPAGVLLTDVSINLLNLWPNDSNVDWIKSAGNWAGMSIFNDTGSPRRGVAIIAQGISGTDRDGHIRLIATRGGQSQVPEEGSAFITVNANQGGTGNVLIGGHTRITNTLTVDGTIHLPPKAIQQSEMGEGSVGIFELVGSVTGAENTGGPAQDNKGVRKIFGNGTSLGASASDHTHGSGNTLDFDYMPVAIKNRVILARQRVKDNWKLLGTLDMARRVELEKEMVLLVLACASILMDAPDFSAEQRTEMRERGLISEAKGNEFFEHRLVHKIESGSKRLHDKDDRAQAWVYDDLLGGHPILREFTR